MRGTTTLNPLTGDEQEHLHKHFITMVQTTRMTHGCGRTATAPSVKQALRAAAFWLLAGIALGSNAQGHWELRSSGLHKLETESASTKHVLIRDSETDVIWESKNATFERPDTSGAYRGVPVGYEVFFRFTWLSPAHQLQPGQMINNRLGIHLTASSKNPQDASIGSSSRVFFVDAATRLDSPAYQIPYSTLYKWHDVDNDAIAGPAASWSDGDRSKHQGETTVTGRVPSNAHGKATHLGMVIALGDYGYWMYVYQWVDGKPAGSERTTSAAPGQTPAEDRSSAGSTASTSPAPDRIAGVYSTTFKELTIHRTGNRVTGTYTYRDGRIEGTLQGNVLTGTWSQDNGKGRLRFVFASDGASFDGKWGYGDAEPTSKWNGQRIGSLQPSGSGTAATPAGSSLDFGTYSTDFNELTLTRRGNKVLGTYKYRDGRVEGTLQGNVLSGTWRQNNGKGKLRFVFAPDGSSFEGKWGYNDAPPTSKWNGKRLR